MCSVSHVRVQVFSCKHEINAHCIYPDSSYEKQVRVTSLLVREDMAAGMQMCTSWEDICRRLWVR